MRDKPQPALPPCERQPPWRLSDRVLRFAGWHCATCWRHERDDPSDHASVVRESSWNCHENPGGTDMDATDAGCDSARAAGVKEAR